jgi:phosphoglycerol transferase MdoB-like AlkP superfamily enzyme
LNKKILLIIVESWGVMKDGRIQKALLEPFFEKRSYFNWIKTGEVNGGTATVAAELDKLCGLEARYLNLSVVTEGFENCLPWQLKQSGYKTAAIHGAAGEMYGRTDWYPRTGFDEIHFKETHSWETHCHSFPGVCDSEIMEKYIANVFSADERRFVYWLTLNTHSLYDRRDIQQDVFDCQAFQLEETGEVCRMNKLHAQFFHQLAELLTHPVMSGVEVLLVGDHAPLILDRNEYKQHIKDGMVSKLHLRVK